MNKNNRRSFIKKLGVAGAAATVAPSAFAKTPQPVELLKRIPINNSLDTIRIALIGAGGMGTADMNTALKHPNVEITAVCDLYTGNLDKAKKNWGSSLFATKDYKEILKRDDVDAVIIGTPDHWHKQIGIDALKAGKHVYCEKPMVHAVDEGMELVKAWKKSGKIFMVGSQGLSSLGNEKAKELLAAGAIGELNYAEGFWARNSPTGAWQYPIPTDASEQTVDWDRFIANTKKRPFDAMRFFRWRNYLDYGTGMSGDLFVHLFSSLHFITNSYGPNKVSAMGGLRFWKDGREVPDVLLGMFNYPDSKQHPGFNLSLRCNFVDGTSGSTYLKIVGSKGSMDVKWEEVVLKRNAHTYDDDPFMAEKLKGQTQKSDRKKMVPPLETVYKAEKGYKGAHYDHFANFFNAIRTGGSVVEDPEFAFRAAAPALLCNDSYKQNKFIEWDPIKMKLI
ncbi:Gfo/Idh/MocA family oxidoreductase [Galbibacter sp. EGI 63066]|uniref:Gfo/Idh/MocA family protein n=1 Tax=Galbibacter sp. EGI 63066 TaxID=2993559 RepID=UPI002248C7BA|nr:Gfo/Idh/MocA family oxidoreductase [Galbibacter sp. EGI 63066]MCX2681306.1 Gfo/Idh/MocA family oxidoreductase [Galbibacter sp. EGI 63066]